MRENCWRFGNAVLDERRWQFSVGGQEVAIERKAFELLRYLVLNAGRAVSKDEILETVWPGRIVGETSLTKCIGRLRKVLGDDDESAIKTVHGVGYRFETPVMMDAGASAPAPPRCRVLFVEDHELFREGLKLLLSGFPHRLEFTETRTASEALLKAEQGAYDLVILDLGLPGQPTGLQALETLRQRLPFANVVVVSGEEGVEVIRAVMARGAAGFIPKASSHAVMVAALGLVLAGGCYVPSYVMLDDLRAERSPSD